MTKDLIVAHYKEDLSWLGKVNNGSLISVYHKGKGEMPFTNLLPNIGREQHTYFYHIYQNYDNLADVNFFTQGNPFDHCRDYLEILNENRWEKESKLNCKNFGTLSNDKVYGEKILECNEDGYPHDRFLPIKNYWGKLFKSPMPAFFSFSPGAIFWATKENLLTNSREWYRLAMELTKEPRAPYVFERLTYYFFCSDFEKSC